MKKTLVAASLIPVLAFALAIAAQIAGLVSFPGLNPTALVGGLVATGVLAFALCDYTRKPSFRVRRVRPAAMPTEHAFGRTSVVGSPDWTYNTRSA